MTNPPRGGSASTSTSQPSETSASGGSDFGATTLSGRTTTDRSGAPGAAPATAERDGTGNGAAAPTQGREHAVGGLGPIPAAPHTAPIGPNAPGAPGPSEPAAGVPRPGEPITSGALPGATSAIRGIRTGRNRGPRRARLQIRHINPVTVLKFSCVLAIALFFVWLIIVGVLFGILDAAGVVNHINDMVTQLNGTGSKPPITAGIVFGGAAIIGVINIVLFIALSTIGAVIYNLCADLVGGVEITLSER